MASYTGIAKSRHKTLVGATVDTLTFSTNYSKVAITMRIPASGSAGIWATTDGVTDPVAAADDTEWIAASAGAEVIVDLGSSDTVKLLSATADAYSVRGVS